MMAPILVLEPISEELPEIDDRDRVLIAAAVAAVAGPACRIVEIKRASGGTRHRPEDRRPYMEEVLRDGPRNRDGAHFGGRWV